MRRLAFIPSIVFLAAPACLALGGVDDETAGPTGGSGGSGGIPGDSSFPDAPGNGGTGGTDAATGGSAGQGTGSGPSWTLSTYNLSTGAWSSVPLSSAWSGANAPPSTGIIAVSQLEHFDRLLVFAEDGNFYLRADGVWQPPVATHQKFPALSGVLRSAYHVSSPPGAPLDESFLLIANPNAYFYEYHSNDAIVFVESVVMSDDPSPAPPQSSGISVFDFEIRNPAKHGAADYYLFYTYFTDGNLYELDAAAAWQKWPVLSSPFWNGKANAPDPSSLQAAFFDAKYGRANFIGLQSP